MRALLAAAGILLLAGAGNSVGFAVRAASLESHWRSEEAVGVAPSRLAPARAELADMRSRWVGPLPYPAASGAALIDPFGHLEATTASNHAAAVTTARQDARGALEELRQASGPNSQEYYAGVLELGRGWQPAELERLAVRWRQEAQATAAQRDQLAAESGGLSDGLPKDVRDGLDRLQQLRGAAAAAGLATDPAPETIAETQIYLARSYPAMLADHASALAEVTAAAAALQKRLDGRRQGDERLARAAGLLSDVEDYGGGAEFRRRLDAARAELSAAETDEKLASALGTLDGLIRDLDEARTKYQRAAAAAAEAKARAAGSTATCIPGAPAQLIVVHLATQQLVAYDNGCPWLQTPVTTGRAALPTDRGTFHVFYKAPVYKMVSPWPRGSPYWYPDTLVYNAMEFVNDGTFIHSAEWQPASSYGAGSQNGPYASHGCVHVQSGPLQQLYNWTAIGATVVVGD
jgi:lipoprotein-anchoring transpeptidase ErfK/SrfK